MHLFGPIALAAALMATSATAAIALGHNGTDHLMWVKGKGSCTGKVISPVANSVCGIAVTLDDGKTYTVKGCPGRLSVVGGGDGTNSFDGECYALSRAKDERCGVHTHNCHE